ncbi:MAG TPA: glycosyltransferase family 87 protein [Candidatus Methylomirabilis sp.]|nr:glycosyltransferase family 87 protein [Candidatus Methylomirabilis sp.]
MSGRNGIAVLLACVGTLSGLLYTLNFRLAPIFDRLGLIAREGDPRSAYLPLYFSLFALYGIAVAAVLRKRHGASCLGFIVGFAVLFRAVLLFAPLVLSDDLYRYIWDGRVQWSGINPYLYPPSAPEIAALRDEHIYPRINRPESPTIYPPGAQMLFAAIAALFPDSITGMRGIMILFDLGTIVLIIRLLKKKGIDPDRVILYAWSPLVIFELAGSGHLEAAMLAFVLLALLSRMDGRSFLAGTALGIATLIKLYPAALFPALYRRGDRVFPLVFAATILAGYLPYLIGAGGKVLGFLPGYFAAAEDFNVGLRDALAFLLGPFTASARPAAILLVTALLGGIALFLARRRQDGDILWRAYLMVSAYLLLLPTSLHPWYVIWILPFLCVFPTWGWLYLSGAVAFSYMKYLLEPEVLPLGIRLGEFVPLVVLLALQAARHRRAATEASRGVTTMAETSR